MEIDEEEDNIVRPKFGKIALEITKRPVGACHHSRITVNPELRKIECSECSEILDPIHVILEYAKKERRFQFRRDVMSNLEKSIKALKEEEKKVKSRLRYQKNKR
jgi:hypothetical protein